MNYFFDTESGQKKYQDFVKRYNDVNRDTSNLMKSKEAYQKALSLPFDRNKIIISC